jgi:D-3-phosphoglycerate dehydrogenase
MPDWKILIADGLAESGLEILQAEAVVEDRSGITPDELQEEIGSYHGVIVRGRTLVTPDVLAAATSLKVVGRAGVGVDNIDLAAAQERGITIVNAPAASSIAVAELTLGLMLSLMRHISQADSTMKSGQWLKKELKGIELNGKVLGIMGVGHIGMGVAHRAAAFGMQVIGYDPFIPPETLQKEGVKPVTLQELYAQADIISLHLPLTPQTRGLLDGQAFAAMKRGVYLICAARGGVIDETALLARLESGQVAGAALDVYASEPPGLTALVAHPHLIATPHIGAQTVEAQNRAAQDTARDVLAALKGEPIQSKIV